MKKTREYFNESTVGPYLLVVVICITAILVAALLAQLSCDAKRNDEKTPLHSGSSSGELSFANLTWTSIDNTPALTLKGITKVTLRNCVFVATSDGESCLKLINCETVVLRDCRFVGGRYGVKATGRTTVYVANVIHDGGTGRICDYCADSTSEVW